MTGVGGRPEIIIQGSNDGARWQDYEFWYKPGNISAPLKWNIPHQPRLDWQVNKMFYLGRILDVVCCTE